MREIDEEDFRCVSLDIKQLYDDFCVLKDGTLRGPSNFNNLTVRWYLNHSDTPNVRCDVNNFDFFSTRLIRKDEEITANYRSYDERGLNFTPCSDSD